MNLKELYTFKNAIVCSYKHANKLKSKYPKKGMLPDANCPNTMFYYINNIGIIRHYQITGKLLDYYQGNLGAIYMPTKYKVKPIE